MSAVTAGSATGNDRPPGTDAGPPYTFITELMRENLATPLKNQAMLTGTLHGYRFRTGQQDSHLVVTLVAGGLRFVDTGTGSFKKLAASCDRKRVNVGVAAVCPVPAGLTERLPLLIEVWPRLGDDYTDTSALPATYAVTVLGDKGRDVAHFGAGPDYFNGYSERDVIWGGGGNDWIRAGLDNDVVDAGSGNDDIVSVEGNDTVRGGNGEDRIWAGDGDDRLWGGDGADFVLCGAGRDSATVDAPDRVFNDCESQVLVG